MTDDGRDIRDMNVPLISKLPKSLLIKRACQHHNRWQKAKAAQLEDLFAEVQYISPHAPEPVLQRIVVNYLRVSCEQKQPEIAALQGQPKHFKRYAQVRHQILSQIAEVYPWLAAECKRQDFL